MAFPCCHFTNEKHSSNPKCEIDKKRWVLSIVLGERWMLLESGISLLNLWKPSYIYFSNWENKRPCTMYPSSVVLSVSGYIECIFTTNSYKITLNLRKDMVHSKQKRTFWVKSVLTTFFAVLAISVMEAADSKVDKVLGQIRPMRKTSWILGKCVRLLENL